MSAIADLRAKSDLGASPRSVGDGPNPSELAASGPSSSSSASLAPRMTVGLTRFLLRRPELRAHLVDQFLARLPSSRAMSS